MGIQKNSDNASNFEQPFRSQLTLYLKHCELQSTVSRRKALGYSQYRRGSDISVHAARAPGERAMKHVPIAVLLPQLNMAGREEKVA